ncbi:GNAT family N-acetyltransferase [Planctomycetota bacterium]
MEIRQYTPELAEEAAEAYNRLVRKVPYCYAVTGEIFREEVAKRLPDDINDAPLEWQTEWIAMEAGRVRGFIQLGAKPKNANEQQTEREGMIRFFWYEPGHRAAGQALLDAGEQILRDHGIRHVQAFHQHYTYRFYQLEYSYLSTHLGHIDALLRLNKYRRTAGEVFLQQIDFDPPEPIHIDLDARTSVLWEEGLTARPNVRVRAYLEDTQVAECFAHGIADYSDDETARDWFILAWLAVDESFRGKYLGRHLLERTMLEMRQAGYRHAVISTAANNHPAFVFYSNLGFEVSDWTFGLSKILS